MQIQMATAKHEREMEKKLQDIEADHQKRQAEIEARYQERRIKLEESLARMGMMERLVAQGLSTGAADSSVLTEMLKQATEQEYATTSDAKVQARAEADKAKQNLETYKEAEDRDRKHQRDMTGLATDMMQASKQQGPSVHMGGGSTPPQGGGPVVVNVPGGQAPQEQKPAKSADSSFCPECGAEVKAGYKFCSGCGKRLTE
jgi:hypothetical protein